MLQVYTTEYGSSVYVVFFSEIRRGMKRGCQNFVREAEVIG